MSFFLSLFSFKVTSNEKKLPDTEEKHNKLKDYGIPLAVMGISLLVVYILWTTFGYIGPQFSDNVLKAQQETLREKYGMPPAEVVEGAESEIPPSLREIVKKNITLLGNST
jgi:hypothetical protein